MALVHTHGNVVVIGGGLAGITAAIDLAEAGLDVSLIEARPWLGGATCSFVRRGLTIDNGQHVFLRCCTAYRELLARLGVTSLCSIQDGLELTVLGPETQARLHRSGLPAPLHLASSLAGYRLLSRVERVKAAAAAVVLQFTEFGGRDGDERSLGDWLATRFQDEHARRVFWDMLAVSALNVAADDADLALGANAIRTAVLAGRDGVDIGIPLVPLGQVHGGPAARLLARLGATIRLGVKALTVQASPAGGYDVLVSGDGLGGDGVSGEAAGDAHEAHAVLERISAAGVVLAVPSWDAAALAPAELDADAARWARLEPSPVVSVHVIYGSRVTRLPFAVAVGSQVHWVVDKTSSAGLHYGQYLAMSVPAADSYVDLPASRLREQFLPLLARLFPAADSAGVEDFFVTRERRATIRHAPGSQRWRAAQSDGLPGLALAGAWTDTGWPDTMEGAVRSGQSAAAKLLADLAGKGALAAKPDVTPGQGDQTTPVTAVRH